nr:hypothetical protein [Micromonospora sp. DSM 115978]
VDGPHDTVVPQRTEQREVDLFGSVAVRQALEEHWWLNRSGLGRVGPSGLGGSSVNPTLNPVPQAFVDLVPSPVT